MSPERWKQIEDLCGAALARPPAERAGFLDRACAGDADLRAEVERLLAVEEAAFFLDEPLVPPVEALDDDALREGERIGAYRLGQPIGRGGMGMVYLAERDDGAFRQQVALKLLRRGLDTEDLLHRFRAERQILASLSHPNIARLLDGGTTTDGRPYLVMEHVEGLPITAYCDRHRLGVEARLRLFRQVCAAVHYAHQNLIVHRDLKPSNILVTEGGVPKLLDFGIAKLLAPEQGFPSVPYTRTEMRLLTPEYASPEQVRGGTITTASDVYALGVLLYELLTGRRPYRFSSRVQQEIERVICEEEPVRPSTAVTQVEGLDDGDPTTRAITPERVSRTRATQVERLRRRLAGDLDNIVLMAMRKEPPRRYNSADQFSEDIRRHLEGLPVAARTDTLAYRVQKFVRRHRAGVASAAVIAMLLLAFAVVTAIQSAQIQARAEEVVRERDRAEQVNDFLVTLFEAADPSETQGETITAQDLLEEGKAQIEIELAGQPELQADLRAVMSRVYRSLGQYAQAEQLARQALDQTRQTYGMHHPRVAHIMTTLAHILRRQGQYAQADSTYRAALTIYRARPGQEEIFLAAALDGLGRVLRQQGEFDAAEAAFREALSIRRRVLGEEHRDVALSLDHLGYVLKEKGDYESAEPLLREALALRRKVLGEEHSSVANSLNTLALLLKEKGDYEGAEPLLREMLALRRNVYGETHPAVSPALHNLARLLHDRGDYDAAEPLLREALALARQHHGAEHPTVATDMQSLGWLLLDKGDHEEAESLIGEALAMRRRLLGNEHTHVAQSLTTLALVHRARADYARAEPLLREALDLYRMRLGEEHSYTAALYYNLARNTFEGGDYEAAEPLYRKALAIYRASLPEHHPRTAEALVGLGNLLEKQGHPDQAELLLREALAGRSATFGEADWRTAEAKAALGICLVTLQRYDEAEPLLQEGYAVLNAHLGPEHRLTVRAQQALAGLAIAVAPGPLRPVQR